MLGEQLLSQFEKQQDWTQALKVAQTFLEHSPQRHNPLSPKPDSKTNGCLLL